MDPQSVLRRFVEAFESLDLDGMMSCYSDEATSFFPVRHHHPKISGKSQIRQQFGKVIDKITAAGLDRISLPVQDMEIADYGETALATFHIMDDTLSRRTLVLRKNKEEWLITHLHASNVPLEDEE